MRRLLVPVTAASLFAFGLVVGRLLWSDRSGTSPPGDDPAALREDIADLKASVEGMRRALLVVGERVVSRPLADPGKGLVAVAAAADASSGLVAAAPRDEALSPEEAATKARASQDPRFRDGESLVAAALSRGNWTERDIESFRALQRQAPGPEWVWLMQRIDSAINEGKIRPDPTLPSWH